tara:strand:+ start:4446 stop:4604 length:159 start_codon:yes stop_codon:yes gene_type:complete
MLPDAHDDNGPTFSSHLKGLSGVEYSVFLISLAILAILEFDPTNFQYIFLKV